MDILDKIELLIIDGELERVRYVDETNKETIISSYGRYFKVKNGVPIEKKAFSVKGETYIKYIDADEYGNKKIRMKALKKAVAELFLEGYKDNRHLHLIDETANMPFHYRNLIIMKKIEIEKYQDQAKLNINKIVVLKT